jgi:hypothetical protein
LVITSEKGSSITLSRRDLFDARFQLLAQADEDKAEEKDELRFVDAPSDLVRGVYEGGLKTWECSVDLAGYLLDRPELLPEDGTTRVLEVNRMIPMYMNVADAVSDRMWDRYTLGLIVTYHPLEGGNPRQGRATPPGLQPLRPRARDAAQSLSRMAYASSFFFLCLPPI